MDDLRSAFVTWCTHGVTDGNIPCLSPSDLTAADLADLTGVAPGTLRVWETRYGFPVAQRLAGNRKRYGDAEVAQVRLVLEHRRVGLSLAAAIERVRAEAPERTQSMFAALREARPDLSVQVLTKPMLLALSYAVEDEQAARAPGGLLLGAFQREEHYRASERRWEALSRTAEMTVILADFPTVRRSPSGPIEVPVASAPVLEREWTVLVHGPSASVCLAGLEVPTARRVRDSERRFELIWSCDPAAVHVAAEVAGRFLQTAAPDVYADIPPALLEPCAPSLASQRFADDVAARAFAYLASRGAR